MGLCARGAADANASPLDPYSGNRPPALQTTEDGLLAGAGGGEFKEKKF